MPFCFPHSFHYYPISHFTTASHSPSITLSIPLCFPASLIPSLLHPSLPSCIPLFFHQPATLLCLIASFLPSLSASFLDSLPLSITPSSLYASLPSFSIPPLISVSSCLTPSMFACLLVSLSFLQYPAFHAVLHAIRCNPCFSSGPQSSV